MIIAILAGIGLLAMLVYAALRLSGITDAEEEHRRAVEWAIKRQREDDFRRATERGKRAGGGNCGH